MIRAALVVTAFLAGPALAGGPPLPFDIGGSFALTDQYGQPRTESDPDGHAQLLFFGYANCPGICATAMPMMADVTDILASHGLTVQPVMITVDPDRDRVGTMTAPLADIHATFIGLTGDESALETAYAAYAIERELAFVDPDYGAVYRHGSFIYLLDAQGEVLTLILPVQDAAHVAGIVQGYLRPKS
ncbi:MAG: SCO family protein [Marinibacterium sp.]